MDSEKQNELVTIFIISDSAGETASKLAQASMAQYPTVEFCLFRRTFVHTEELLMKALNDAKAENGMIIYTLIDPKLSKIAKEFCDNEDVDRKSVV